MFFGVLLKRSRSLFVVLLAFACVICASVISPGHARESSQKSTGKLTLSPRLVVVISIDQFRPDYLRRFYSHYLPARKDGKVGGFRFLMEEGANYAEAEVDHFPTYTGPGHAVITTGAPPSVCGIVGNYWYSRKHGLPVYCVMDPLSEPVGYTSKYGGASPRMLLTTTVGDELKLATANKAKVVGLSLKDRAAILMAGHKADLVLWKGGADGSWGSSSYYCPDGKLPKWVETLNSERYPLRYFGKDWTPLVPEALEGTTRQPPEESLIVKYGLGTRFPHPLKGSGEIGPEFIAAFGTTPFANEYLFYSTKQAIVNEQLGMDEVPDLLVLNLASNDYVGHVFGPDSPEVADITIRTDRQLADFFQFLDDGIGLDKVVIAVTSDHGVSPIPGDLKQQGIRAGMISADEVTKVAGHALDEKFGDFNWIATHFENSDPHVYLDHAVVKAAGRSIDEAATVVANALTAIDGIQQAVTREQILRDQLPPGLDSRLIRNGFHQERSGDVLVICEPYWFTEVTRYATTHGSVFGYDTKVPLLVYGSGLFSGTFYRKVSTRDIAPTLSQILGINVPSGNQGTTLQEIFPR